MNPQCTVPVLQTQEGLRLTDNAAIAAYLEARYPEPPLLGSTPEEKAAIASWNWCVEFEGLLSIAETLRNSSPALVNRALPGLVDYAQIPELAERGLARIRRFFDTLDARLLVWPSRNSSRRTATALPKSPRSWRSTSRGR
jgi:glutathione S-transferase